MSLIVDANECAFDHPVLSLYSPTPVLLLLQANILTYFKLDERRVRPERRPPPSNSVHVNNKKKKRQG